MRKWIGITMVVGAVGAFWWFAVTRPAKVALAAVEHGAIGTVSHMLAIRAFHLAPAGILAPFQYLEILGATNAVADAAVSAVTLAREALVACAPEVVVLLLPGASAAEAAISGRPSDQS